LPTTKPSSINKGANASGRNSGNSMAIAKRNRTNWYPNGAA
jgi:hypothetical protein